MIKRARFVIILALALLVTWTVVACLTQSPEGHVGPRSPLVPTQSRGSQDGPTASA